MKFLCRALVVTTILMPSVSAGPDQVPAWIWPAGERDGDRRAVFRKHFTIDQEVDSARLKITSDFARFDVRVNGEAIAAVEAFDPPLECDIRPFLETGNNEIEIRAEGVSGPSAVAAKVSIDWREGGGTFFITGDQWSGQPGETLAVLGKIDSHRWAPNRLPEVSPFAEYNQWKEATPGAREQLSPLPPGYEIEKLYTAKEGEDSWVSMTFDPDGRIIIGKEQRGLLRLTLPDGEGGDVRSEVINDTLEECRGLVFRNGDLYANANRSRALFRLRDSDEDDAFEEVTLLRRTEGSTGHGRNDLELGPDGNIHAIHGDVVLVPEDSRLDPVPEKGAPKELGHWVSTTPEGEGWRIHCRGLRNPYGIAFNPDGEAFSYDADNEGDVGLPFYRPTRINHLVSGANYGWHQGRGNTRNFPVYAPDTVPTTFDVGRGSPTAVKFGTRSSFPAPYGSALFALDWAYGRIIAVHLVPRGASYYASGEVFLEGRPLNVTDLDFDADGNLLFITGGRKTQSALYRIRADRAVVFDTEVAAQQKAREKWSEHARRIRRGIEGTAIDPGAYLGHPDPWIRNAARVVLERRDLEKLRDRALAEGRNREIPPNIRLGFLLALARQGNEKDAEAAAEIVSRFDRGHRWTRPEQLAALRIYEIFLNQVEEIGPLSETINEQVEPWLSSLSDPVRREAIRVLAATGSDEAVPAGLRFMAAAEEQLERLHYLEMLSETRAGWSPETRTAFFEALAHSRRFSFGDRYMEGFFNTAEINAVAGITDEEEKNRLVAILEAAKSDAAPLAPLPPPRKPVKAWTVTDLADVLDLPLDQRNLENGRKMFDAALCSRCHVAGNHGRPVGPDLTNVASRFSRRDLLEAIIEPSKVVAEVHRNSVIRKKDGTAVQGRIIQNDFRKSLLYVSTSPFLPGDLTEIPKSEIESFEESLVSPMPPALLDTLTKDEILDLLAWLEDGGAR